MIRKWLGIVLLMITAATLLVSSSCARSQKLEGITITPSSFTYFSPAPPGVLQTPIPLTAYGSYIHPPANKNVTTQAVWASDNPNVAVVGTGGALTAGAACGIANISASVYDDGNMSGNVVVGFMTVTVQGPASEGCPTSTATSNLSIDITAGSADGSITSSPSGINCGNGGNICSAAFPTSSSVALTATPNSGKSFLGWSAGCPSVSGGGLTCTVVLTSDTTVNASFN